MFVVEYPIGGVKRSRIVYDTFRNRKDKYVDLVMKTDVDCITLE